MNGIDGDLIPSMSWRWTESDEDRFLADRPRPADETQKTVNAEAGATLVAQPGDWPEMRGPGRLGNVHGEKFGTDWNKTPPKSIWRQRVGPAWSSIVIIGPMLFTQEQRGPKEAVVALDAATGRELWSHEDETRFWDSTAGAGPRATPTFVNGRIYAQGATGLLNCLDAATGKLIWTRDIKADSGAPLPIWGFSSSPEVIDGLVIAYAGGTASKQLIAYRADSGEIAWTAVTGPVSYSSAQKVSIDGQSQILMLSDQELLAVEPASGKTLWQAAYPSIGIWRVMQPRLVEPADVLIGSEDLGLIRLGVSRKGDGWQAEQRWATKAMKPAYNDPVILDDHAFGFDGGIFCCVDMASGERRWKGGRYGHGQVLLLVEQRLLFVITETGEGVLLAANPKKLEELGRFAAIEGKTWNYPTIAHGRLYVRNDAEMACYELPVAEPEVAAR